jgi:hypothetical protein
MSQRLNAGFNAPRFPVEAGEPDGIGPSITACSFNGRALRFIVSSLAWPSRQSRAEGIAKDDCRAALGDEAPTFRP